MKRQAAVCKAKSRRTVKKKGPLGLRPPPRSAMEAPRNFEFWNRAAAARQFTHPHKDSLREFKRVLRPGSLLLISGYRLQTGDPTRIPQLRTRK